MTNNELRDILEWVEKNGSFIWSDLQKHFKYEDKEMILVQRTLKSNLPIRENLVGGLSTSSKDPNALVLTQNGRTTLINLRSNSSKNHWYQKLSRHIMIVITGLIVAGITYYLGWT